MRRALTLPLLLLLAATATLPTVDSQGTVLHTLTGSYHVGSPYAHAGNNACVGGLVNTNGIDSSCKALPAGTGSLFYTIAATDSTSTALVKVCFYAGSSLLGCNPTANIIPTQATKFAITSQTGLSVQWTLTIFD